MDPVSMLIFNTLAQRRGINLPDIGSLYVVSTAARIQEDGNLIPPVSRVLFSSEMGSENDDMIRLIGESSGKQEEQSREIYAAWRTAVQSETGIHILSVGDIVEGVFTISPELDRTLNPSGTALVALKRQWSPRQVFFWVAVTVMVGGGLAAGLITFLNSQPSPYDAPYAEAVPMNTLAEADSMSVPQNAEVVLEALTESERETQVSQASSASVPSGDHLSVSSTSSTAGPQPASSVKTPPRSGDPGGATAPVSAVPEKETPPPPTPRKGEMHYYVVVGTYSTDANAERFIASARQKDATQNYRKLPLSSGKIMVYTADAASEVKAQQQRRAVSGTFPDAWVFKRRAR